MSDYEEKMARIRKSLEQPEVFYISARMPGTEDWQFAKTRNGGVGGPWGQNRYEFKADEVTYYVDKLHQLGYETHVIKLGSQTPGIDLTAKLLEDVVKELQDNGFTADLQPPRRK